MYSNDQVAKIYTPWTNKLALPAKHAFPYLFFQRPDFSTLEQCMDPSYVEPGKLTRTARSRAGSASNANQQRRLHPNDIAENDLVI
jgi:hypothetical protein